MEIRGGRMNDPGNKKAMGGCPWLSGWRRDRENQGIPKAMDKTTGLKPGLLRFPRFD
jgi:hypothetical protein